MSNNFKRMWGDLKLFVQRTDRSTVYRRMQRMEMEDGGRSSVEDNSFECSNPCEEHLDFQGEVCPVCLMNENDELKIQLTSKGLGSDVDQILKRGRLIQEREELKALMKQLVGHLSDEGATLLRDKLKQVEEDIDYITVPKGEVEMIVDRAEKAESQLTEAEERYIVQRDGVRDAMQHIEKIKAQLAESQKRIQELEEGQ